MEQIYNSGICASAFRWAECPSLSCLSHLSLPTFPFLTLPFILIPFYWILTDISSANHTQMHAQSEWGTVVQLPRKRKFFPVPREEENSCTKCAKCSACHGVHQPLMYQQGQWCGRRSGSFHRSHSPRWSARSGHRAELNSYRAQGKEKHPPAGTRSKQCLHRTPPGFRSDPNDQHFSHLFQSKPSSEQQQYSWSHVTAVKCIKPFDLINDAITIIHIKHDWPVYSQLPSSVFQKSCSVSVRQAR